jgi:hypothetical protein
MMPYHLNRVVASNISSTILNQELNAKLKESEIGGNLTSTQVFELGDESLKYYRGILWRVGLQKNRVFSEDVGDVATAGVMGSHAVCIFERATESLDQNLAC